MKVRIEIDEKNGKAFNTEIDDSNYDSLREYLLKIRDTEQTEGSL